MLFPDSLGPRKQDRKSYGVLGFLFWFDFFVCLDRGCFFLVGVAFGWVFLFSFLFSCFGFLFWKMSFFQSPEVFLHFMLSFLQFILQFMLNLSWIRTDCMEFLTDCWFLVIFDKFVRGFGKVIILKPFYNFIWQSSELQGRCQYIILIFLSLFLNINNDNFLFLCI